MVLRFGIPAVGEGGWHPWARCFPRGFGALCLRGVFRLFYRVTGVVRPSRWSHWCFKDFKAACRSGVEIRDPQDPRGPKDAIPPPRRLGIPNLSPVCTGCARGGCRGPAALLRSSDAAKRSYS